MSDNGKAGIAHYDSNGSVKKGHFKRFWWVYLLVLVVVVAIVVPVL